MPRSAVFEELRRYPIDSLNMEFQEYRHIKTGARHYHLAADDDQNAFLVAFLTVPQDSTGVAHILEHTALCGSKRFLQIGNLLLRVLCPNFHLFQLQLGALVCRGR